MFCFFKRKKTDLLSTWTEVYVIPADKTHIGGNQHVVVKDAGAPSGFA